MPKCRFVARNLRLSAVPGYPLRGVFQAMSTTTRPAENQRGLQHRPGVPSLSSAPTFSLHPLSLRPSAFGARLPGGACPVGVKREWRKKYMGKK